MVKWFTIEVINCQKSLLMMRAVTLNCNFNLISNILQENVEAEQKKPISKEKRKLMVSNLVAMAMKFEKRMLQILTLNYASQSRCLKSEQNFF